MQTTESISTRRSVKHYQADFAMPEKDIRKIMELALLSPTSFNMQNWRFLVITDPAIREQIYGAAFNQAQVIEASFVVLLCADLLAHEREPARYWKDASPQVAEVIVPMIESFYRDQPQLQRDEAHRSCGIAAQTIMLAARSMGYDSCPMVGFDPAAVASIVNLPADYCISLMITVGKALKPAHPRPGQLPYDEVVFSDRFA
ncbi:MAG: nitroreductase family protein [Puniceicoccaceae bacterium]